MKTVLTYSDLETAPNISVVTGANVNPTQPKLIDFEQETTADGSILRVLNDSTSQWGGGLVKIPVPFINIGRPLPYWGLDLELRVREECLPLLGRLETDVKACVGPVGTPNVADWSTQFKTDQGWMFQVDDPSWIDTGDKPAPLVADTWTPLSLRFSYDPVALKSSVLSCLLGSGPPLLVPATLQNIPLLNNGWANGAIQLQTEVLKPGLLEVQYRKITLTMSDAPIL